MSQRRARSVGEILLVRPIINEERDSALFMPMGLLCLAAVLRDAGFSSHVVDYEFLHRLGAIDTSDYLVAMCEPIIARRPSIVGVTVLSESLPLAIEMGRYIKRRAPEVTLVLGGPGVFGTLPCLLERFPDAMDYVCKAEGEIAFLSLVEAHARGEARPTVPGMYVNTPGGPVDGGQAPWLDLDRAPMPAYDLVDVDTYLQLGHSRVFYVYVGSGCTYACSFCTTAPFWLRTFRVKSPATVLKELDRLHEQFAVTRFDFVHDNFANKKEYIEQFTDYFERHNTRYEWSCSVRSDNLTLAQIRRMKRAGCFNLFCGTDSGSTKILRKMRKLPSCEKSYGFFRACQESGVALETNTIVGYPDESDEDLEASLAVILDAVAHGSTSSDVSVLQPLAGAPVTKEHADHVTFLEQGPIGLFHPPEILALARENLDLFPGFGFIRYQNHDYQYYADIVKLIRYFTRHYFMTVYFLKEACGVEYRELFEFVAARGSGPLEYGACLREFLAQLALAPALMGLTRSVFGYDSAVEQLRAVDVANEFTNLFRPSPRRLDGQSHLLVAVDHEVHRIFARMPDLDIAASVQRQSNYLLYIDVSQGQIVTVLLSAWQRRLWDEWQHAQSDPRREQTLSAFAADFAASQGVAMDHASALVRRMTESFERIVASPQDRV